MRLAAAQQKLLDNAAEQTYKHTANISVPSQIAEARHGRARRPPQPVRAAARVSRAIPSANSPPLQRPRAYRRDLCRRALGNRLVPVAPAGSELGVAAGDPRVLLLEHVRVVDPQVRDAPAGRRVGPARDLRPAHAPAPPVLHRQRDERLHFARVADHLLSVARAVHLHGARNAVRDRPRLPAESERGLHPDGHDRRAVPDLRDVPLLLPRARQLVRAPHAVHQHDPPASLRAPQLRDHDDVQHEPDVPDRRLGDGHERRETQPDRHAASTATTRTTCGRS